MRRLIPRTGMTAPALACALWAGVCAGADAPPISIEERSVALCNRVMAEGAAALLASAASARIPHAVLRETLANLDLGPGENLVILSGEGEMLFSCATGKVMPRSPRRAVWKQVAHMPEGSAYYYDMDRNAAQVVRRAVAWVPLVNDPGGEILMAECSEPTARAAEVPLTGKWLGAYSQTTWTSRDVRLPSSEEKSAGQVSVLAVQNLDRLLLRCSSPDWQLAAEGLVVDDRFSAGGGRLTEDGSIRETWIVEGEYDPEKDAIRGTVSNVQRDRVVRRTFFLKPVAALPAP